MNGNTDSSSSESLPSLTTLTNLSSLKENGDISPMSKDKAALNPSANKDGKAKKKRKRERSPESVVIIKKLRRGKANDRERNRMHGLNDALENLR